MRLSGETLKMVEDAVGHMNRALDALDSIKEKEKTVHDSTASQQRQHKLIQAKHRLDSAVSMIEEAYA